MNIETNENYIDEEKCYKVYKHTSPSGKSYVGMTKQDPEKRYNNGWGYRQCTHFWNAIQKYGWENITHEILFDKLTLQEACDLEQKIIQEYDLRNPEKGYNLQSGGIYTEMSEETKKKISEKLIGNTCRLGIPHTEKTKQKMSEAHKGEKSHMFGTHLSDKTKQKLSDARRGKKASENTKEKLSQMRVGEGNSFYGKHHTEETKKRLSKINTGKKHTNEAKQKMSEARKGKKFSEEHKKNLGNSRKKPVVQLTMYGDFIREWDGCIDAKKELGILHINDVCNGNRKHAGGFKWVWKDEYYD